MSSSYDSSGKPIPMGILVKKAKHAEQSERPTPRRKSENGERQIPWLWIAAGGSAGWVVIVLTVALLTRNQEKMAEPDQPLLVRAIDNPIAKVPAPNIAKPVAIDEGDHVVAPVAAVGPKLNPKQIRQDDAPPAIDIPPQEFKPQPVAAPAPAAPGPVLPRPARREVDQNVFADCNAIGTDILFVKDMQKTFLRAKDERKLVFVVHLSGNLEDPGFT
jgi:hypothetical protein